MLFSSGLSGFIFSDVSGWWGEGHSQDDTSESELDDEVVEFLSTSGTEWSVDNNSFNQDEQSTEDWEEWDTDEESSSSEDFNVLQDLSVLVDVSWDLLQQGQGIRGNILLNESMFRGLVVEIVVLSDESLIPGSGVLVMLNSLDEESKDKEESADS